MALNRRYPLIRYLGTEQQYISRVRAALARAAAESAAAIGTAGALDAARLRAQQAAIESHLATAWNSIEQSVYEGQRAAMDEAARVLEAYQRDLLVGFGLPAETIDAIITSESVRAQAGVAALAARAQYSRKALAESVWANQRRANSQLDKIIDTALARGLTARQLAAQVRGFVSPTTPGGVSYAAMRLARTEINNAYHAASVETYKRSKMVEKVAWNLSSSHPEGDICDDYKTDGPYDVDEVPEKPHPHCFCFTTAVLPTREQFIDDLFDGKYDDPASVAEPTTPTAPAAPPTPRAGGARVDTNLRPTSAPPPSPGFSPVKYDDIPVGSRTIDNYYDPDTVMGDIMYQSTAYKEMNAVLRGSAYPVGSQISREQAEVWANALRRGMQNGKGTAIDMRVDRYQTMSGMPPGDPSTWAGGVWRQEGFTSTYVPSARGGMPSHLRGVVPDDANVHMIINVPRGSMAHSGNYNHAEIILAPGTEMVINSVRQVKGVWEVIMTVTRQDR